VLDDAGRRVVEEYASVARSIAWEFWRRAPRADVEELQAIALAALVEAAERFPRYQAEHGYPLDDHRYLGAYLTRRMRGSILDWARGEDHVTRSQRAVLKSIEAPALAGAITAELAAAVGLPEQDVRAALAAQEAGRPLRLDESFDSGAGWGVALVDPADVESVVAVRAITGAAARALAGLPLEQQVIIARRYLHGDDLEDIAQALGITRDRASRLHETAVLAIHGAMLAEAAESCACRNGACGCGARRGPRAAE
jgi:RNA polymerase sigma factor (sigma-70 family)